ncbi:hypothetical protein FB45DRAFT_249267 [Roridomyces roridus]|uniref:Uncharacterized protein n=1 Tax=Roridomyces roridus TaxID=1738132 RepID=A0AAD7FC10_9AGAR|nr:hypothetical protein FB45DRAFT_249267 [Roridomyces roridus]
MHLPFSSSSGLVFNNENDSRLFPRGSSSSSTGPIIAAAICGALAFFSLTALIWVCARRKRELRDKEHAIDLRTHPFPLSAKPGHSKLQTTLSNTSPPPVLVSVVSVPASPPEEPGHKQPRTTRADGTGKSKSRKHKDIDKERRHRSSISKPPIAAAVSKHSKWRAQLPPISQGYGVGAGWYATLDPGEGEVDKAGLSDGDAEVAVPGPSKPARAAHRISRTVSSFAAGVGKHFPRSVTSSSDAGTVEPSTSRSRHRRKRPPLRITIPAAPTTRAPAPGLRPVRAKVSTSTGTKDKGKEREREKAKDAKDKDKDPQSASTRRSSLSLAILAARRGPEAGRRLFLVRS